MLSDNIRSHRKKNGLSQDELAEKVGVSRQSVSFWENGQTQPTIDNIIALAKIFNISSDMLLGNTDNISQDKTQEKTAKKNSKVWLIAAASGVIAVSVIAGAVMLTRTLLDNDSSDDGTNTDLSAQTNALATADTQNADTVSDTGDFTAGTFDLFAYCRDFAIEKGNLNGDYTIYQQPAENYGGYQNEYFSVSYWADSDMVEFCLHCPLSETISHNFYIRMRGGYDGKYEYLSSKYYRATGESQRSAMGYIDPVVFSDSYPISCDVYEGDTEGQTEFMEQSRVGICDLVKCLKNFVTTEKMQCGFSDFEFVNF